MADRKAYDQERFGNPAQALFGNAALDMAYFPEYMPGTGAVEPRYDQPEYAPRKAEPIHIKQAEPQRKVGVSVFAVLGSAVLAVLTVCVLLANAMLTQLTDEQAQLQERYAELMEENRILTVQYEMAFNMNELEEYATVELGMVKPVASQLVMLPDYTEDRVVILDENLGRRDFAHQIGEFFSSLLEYIA